MLSGVRDGVGDWRPPHEGVAGGSLVGIGQFDGLIDSSVIDYAKVHM